MLTKQNCRAAVVALALAAGLGSGCAPSGPRALLQGDKLLREGRYAEAARKFQTAVALMPKSAQAWNHLGLASHGHGQLEDAARAYRTALTLDHKLMAARFNLGCVYLDQANPLAALDEFTSYTLAQPAYVNAWLKRGTAELRLRRLDAAEKSFRTALDLDKQQPEALNGLGLIQAQRRRWAEASNAFAQALSQDPAYAPAMLNLAILHQHHLHNRAQAARFYQQYLALHPRPAEWENAQAALRQLENETKPVVAATRAAPTNPPPAAVAKVAPAATNPPARTLPAADPPRGATALLSSNTPRAGTSPARNTPPSPVVTNVAALATRAAPLPPAAAPPPAPVPPVLEVAQLPDELVVRPARDVAALPSPPAAGTTARDGLDSAPTTPGRTNANRRGLLERLNPFASRGNAPGNGARSSNASGGGTGGTAVLPVTIVAARPAEAPAPAPPPVDFVRYAYRNPAAPPAGRRAEAEKHFARGLKAQQAGQRAQAMADYRAAIRSDPAFFEPYHNLGLAALQEGNWQEALSAYEFALALRPDATDARYNFALALKSGNYTLDAADQLRRVLALDANDARAHLSLANLCAQQLRQPAQARTHYEKVLELAPRHPEAGRIRYWLALNP